MNNVINLIIIICCWNFEIGIQKASSTKISSNILSLYIKPTAYLINNDNDENRRRLLESANGSKYNSAIYGPLHSEETATDYLEEFNEVRNVSRYERDLQLDDEGRRRLQPYSYQNSPLLQGFGTHYVTAWVGTPPQRKSVIVDTGSHYTAFPCEGCNKCGEEYHTDKYFDPAKSSTFHALSCGHCVSAQCSSLGRCEFSQSYTEGSSWQAYQAIDRYFIGSNKNEGRVDPVDNSFAIEFMFGCQTSEQGLFVTQLADGIMGMSAHEATFHKQLYNKKKLAVNQFSLCFGWALSVSKDGVHSGIVTLGGIDTRLHSSPMVFAKNMVLSGWYTVYVKNIFLRKGGGISSASPPGTKIIKLPIDHDRVNSGKGVIVDSGTTDTYLSKSLEASFLEAWKSITGIKYSNSAMRLSSEVVKGLPTILIQMKAFDEGEESSSGNGVGLAGELDPKNPRDIVIAVPALHYMEYTPSRDTYTSRLYFTESRGGVLGANAMQGHDVLFDWENGRVGFAESSCKYSDLVKDSSIFIKAGSTDCLLSNPSISSACVDSVEATSCVGEDVDPNLFLSGVEKYVWVIEKEASSNGKSCEEVAKESLVAESNTVKCTEKGLCHTLQECHVTCQKVLDSRKPSSLQEFQPVTSTDLVNKVPCGDSVWGACTSSCSQSKIMSYLTDDGQCNEMNDQVQTRPCHIHSCLMTNPCRVPFLVHAIFGLGGINPELWTQQVQDSFVEALADVVGAGRYFGPGDVNILMRNPWTPDLSGNMSIGVKLIIEISISNPKFLMLMLSSDDQDISTTTSARDTACGEEELYIFAKSALDVHTELQRNLFLSDLFLKAEEFISLKEESSSFSYFKQDNVKVSKVLTSWTIKTEVGGRGTVHDHSNDEALRNGWFKRIQNILPPWRKTILYFVLFVFAASFFLYVCLLTRNINQDSERFKALDQILSTKEIISSNRSRNRFSQVTDDNGYDLRYARDKKPFVL